MMNCAQRELGYAFLKIFLRDRQSLFFSLLMPFLFLTLLGSIYGRAGDSSVDIGVVDNAQTQLSQRFVASLRQVDRFSISLVEETDIQDRISSGELTLVLVIPEEFSEQDKGVELPVMFDGGKLTLVSMAMPVLERTLVGIERELRDSEPMFNLKMQNVQSRNTRYIDFLLPGILALSLMQTSIAGSGFNIVEYRRRGILKRLFVSPIESMDFIVALCISRVVLVVAQVTVLMAIGVFLLGANVVGSFALLYGIVCLGTLTFLCMGFAIGGVSKTQESVNVIGNLVILPQMFLSGIFFPIEAMPEWLQPGVVFLPLSFIVRGMREVAVSDASLLAIVPSLAGIAVWIVVCFVLATRLFVWRDVAQ